MEGWKGEAGLPWEERETRIMLACVLKVEENAGEKLVQVRKRHVVEVPISQTGGQPTQQDSTDVYSMKPAQLREALIRQR